jgi:glycerophosphoryl diester phosphodiesterase
MTRSKPKRAPLVIAHRGASGYVPEHTLAAYTLAIQQGADFIEPDLVMTKDGHFIARHDNTLNLTTDVATRAEFGDRQTEKTVDGTRVTGWFSEDFSLAEIKRLRAVERIPHVRPNNVRFNGQFEIPTLQEIIDLARAQEKASGRTIGIYPETKHPSYFRRLDLAMEKRLVQTLHANGYDKEPHKIFIQSFEIENLQDLRRLTRLPLVQLLWGDGKPYDVDAVGGALTYDRMATAAGLSDIAAYADAVGPEKNHFILPLDVNGALNSRDATDFVKLAHAAGLAVHPYTFRAENHFLPSNYRRDTETGMYGDLVGEIAAFLATGIDGFFTDHSDIGVRARDRVGASR